MRAASKWLTVAEVAERCGVTVQIVYVWIHKGIGGRTLRASRIRGRIHVAESDLAHFNAPVEMERAGC